MSEQNKNYLYGLTVQGIQSYIFATDKLKEFVGASEIVEQLCTTWFYKFLNDPNKNGNKGIYHLNAAGNIRFQTDKVTAKTIFEEYHKVLLKKAPGVPFSQAVVEIEDGKEYEAIQELDKKLRGQRNQPMYEMDLGIMTRSKFRRTGDFAWKENDKVIDKNKFVDKVTYEKYENSDAKALTGKIQIGDNYVFPKEFSDLTKGGKHSWLAVVHIDGNGMGLQIKKILEEEPKKFHSLKTFSDNVNDATIKAFQTAIDEVVVPQADKDNNTKEGKIILPIRPIILGGDDVTVIIRADLALEFTKVYLENFEKNTKGKEKEINEGKGLTAAAGIAFVKEKFPFHYSADLAEDLCVYAKNKSNRKHSCIHFHRVQDSVVDNYKEIIVRELTAKDVTYIAGPYYLQNSKQEPSIEGLLKEVYLLKNEDSPKNGIREYIDVSFGQPEMLKTIEERLYSKMSKTYKEIIKNTPAFMDYHTLLAVNTKTK